MKYIAIGTDSWCQGEWHLLGNDLKVVHSGFIRVIESRYPTIGHYKAGGSNLEALDRIERNRDYLSGVIWIQTDPLRDLSAYKSWQLHVKSISAFERFLEYNQEQINQRLDSLGVPVFMYGGACDLPTGIRGRNLSVCERSLSKWINPQHTEVTYSENFRHRFLADWSDAEVAHFDLDLLEHLEQQSDQAAANRVDRTLYPDGFHPSLALHNQLGDHLLDLLKTFDLPTWEQDK